MWMQIGRFTRLTNGFSKKLENLKAALALHFTNYNFVRIHGTLLVIPCDGRWYNRQRMERQRTIRITREVKL